MGYLERTPLERLNVMQITLSTQQSRILESLARQGQYTSLEETIDAALVLLAEQVTEQNSDLDPDYLAWLEETRLKVDEGLQDIEVGQVIGFDMVMAQLQNKVDLARAESA
ncbi:hypothetical protein [Picosynechococcus sp. PCC 11901]|uniref:hypothetical protein n=1 Tax=Picosynechococcus sp. PCC 11901 TaxID=2579791 RepID=UPI0010FE1B19|nr:hypothetical protein [Picosynechococcus sp. PCC 11901]